MPCHANVNANAGQCRPMQSAPHRTATQRTAPHRTAPHGQMRATVAVVLQWSAVYPISPREGKGREESQVAPLRGPRHAMPRQSAWSHAMHDCHPLHCPPRRVYPPSPKKALEPRCCVCLYMYCSMRRASAVPPRFGIGNSPICPPGAPAPAPSTRKPWSSVVMADARMRVAVVGSDPTESWHSPPMPSPRSSMGHAGALYDRVYGDPDHRPAPLPGSWFLV